MRPVHAAWLLCLALPTVALAASAPPSKGVPPPKCTSEVGFPAMDAASKDAAKMSIKVKPEMSRTAHGATGGGGAGKIMSHNIGSQSSSNGAGRVASCGGAHADESPKETAH